MFPFDNMEMISDEDLIRTGLYDQDSKLYDVPEELIAKPFKEL